MSVILRRLRWMIAGLNKGTPVTPKRLHSADVRPVPLSPLSKQQQLQLLKSYYESKSEDRKPKQPMLEAVHEISIYIHRFHNLDLFQQGWYQIKITMRWENGDNGVLGTPSRVIQYEGKFLEYDETAKAYSRLLKAGYFQILHSIIAGCRSEKNIIFEEKVEESIF